MNILITGGCGFIGSHVAERFFKEGHKICIIDNLSTGTKANLSVDYDFYQLNVTDKNCEEVFRTNNIDCVIHLAAQVDVAVSNADAYLDSESNILGLINMLDLARKYKVRKFLFASSAAIYGNTEDLPIIENTELQPVSVYGMNKQVGEYYCRQWSELYGLKTVILRFANVYGPRQGLAGEAGVVSIFMQRMLEEKEVVVYGDGTQTRDYIFVEDVADAVFRAATSKVTSQIMNVATNTETSLADVIAALGDMHAIKGVRFAERRTGEVAHSRLDNFLVRQELGWQQKYSLREGLAKTYTWYQAHWTEQATAAAIDMPSNSFSRWRPHIENSGMFILMLLFSWNSLYGGTIDYRLGLDYNYIYIGLMGILYGKKQSLPAVAFSAVLFIGTALARGGDFVSIMYQAQYLTHLAAYLCIGVATGYVRDNSERIAADKQMELDAINSQYNFMRTLYLECNQRKDELHSQIINANDSIGKIYNIVRALNSLKMEDISNEAIGIVGKIMQTDGVALYTVNRGKTYWRLKVQSSGYGDDQAKSIKIADSEYARYIMDKKRMFINNELRPDSPLMAAPVIYEGRVIAIVALKNLPFENLTLYHENLFQIVVMLVTDAFTKAYLYDKELEDRKYIAQTEILTPEKFEDVLEAVESRRQLYGQEHLLLKVIEPYGTYEEVYQRLAGKVRDEDYVGLRQDGALYLLMLNIPVAMAAEVQQRLSEAGIQTSMIMGGCDDE